jgi:hypothetical protein
VAVQFFLMGSFSFFINRPASALRLFHRLSLCVFFVYIAIRLLQAFSLATRFPIFGSVAAASAALFSIWIYSAVFPIPTPNELIGELFASNAPLTHKE